MKKLELGWQEMRATLFGRAENRLIAGNAP